MDGGIARAYVTDASLAATSNVGLLNARTTYVTPTGVAATDTAALQAAFTAMSAVGGTVLLGAGDYYVNALVSIPAGSPLTVRGAGIGKTRIFSSVNDGQVYNAAFYGSSTFGTPGTLAAGVTGGSAKTFTSTTSMNVGDWCIIGNAAGSAIYQIKAKSGGPTYTYTTDRVILRSFSGGDTMTPITAVMRDIVISDMTFTQVTNTGLRAINFIGAVRCAVRDIEVSNDGAAALSQAGSFDTNCLECECVRLIVRCPLTSQGWSIESSERCRLIDCQTDYCVIGQYIIDSYDCEVRGGSASCCTSAGLKIGSALPGGGSSDIRVFGGTYSAGTAHGVVLGLGNNYRLVGVTANNNGTSGILVGNDEVLTDVSLEGCYAKANASYNFWIDDTATRVQLTDLFSASGASIGLLIQGEATLDGFSSISDYYALYPAMAVGKGAFLGSRIRIASAVVGVTIASTIRAQISDAEIGGGTVIDHTTANELVLENVATATTGGGTKGYQGIAASTVRFLGRVDLSTTETPLTINATGLAYMAGESGVGAVTITGANVTATWAQYAVPLIEVTGAVTGSRRDLILPRIKGHIWTINCGTTGGFGIRAIASSGTGVNINDATVARVYFDGTNFVSAT